MAVEGRFSIFLHYLFIAPREKYHTLVVRDSNGANWHAAPFFATLFFFSTLVPRTSKEFEPCTYPSFIRFRVATAEQGSSPSSPPRFILYRSMDGVSLSFMDDGFFRRIDEKNFRRGGEMTTLIVRISLEIGATKLIHEVDERHNFEKTISSSRQLSRAFFFFFCFQHYYIEIGPRNWPTILSFVTSQSLNNHLNEHCSKNNRNSFVYNNRSNKFKIFILTNEKR